MRLLLIFILEFIVEFSNSFPIESKFACNKWERGIDSKIVVLDLDRVSTGVYISTVYVGTPPQPIKVSFDTGSSDSWIKLIDSTECLASAKCKESDQMYFNETASTSFQSLNSSFSMIYGGGEINGTWSTDNYVIRNLSIPSFRFGAGNISKSLPFSHGLIGLGLDKFESTYTFEYGIKRIKKNTYSQGGKRYPYDNFPIRLKKQGHINKNCYSVYYPNGGESKGKIIFGGVDTKKYDSLITIPIIQKASGDWSGYTEPSLLAVGLDQINVEYKHYKSPILNKDYPALVDTLTYLMYAPESVINNLATLLGGKYNELTYGIVYPCREGINISFNFGGCSILKSAKDLSERNREVCIFPIGKNDDDYIILGGKFMTQFYTFFNLDDLEISIGNYKDNQQSLIKEVNNKPPNAKDVPNYISTFTYSSANKLSLNYTCAIYNAGGHG